MATITSSIGSNSRDYSTFTLWEADDGNATGADDAVGEGYNDSAFSESPTINSTVPLSWHLKAATGEEHDGTAGTGVRIVYNGAFGGSHVTLSSADDTIIERIEVNGNSLASVALLNSNTGNTITRCIVHNAEYDDGNTFGIQLGNFDSDVNNCIVYDIMCTATGSANCTGIKNFGGTGRNYYIDNNTVWNIDNDGGTGPTFGIDDIDNVSGYRVRNNIVGGLSGNGTGGTQDFQFNGTNPVSGGNISSDDTADNAGESNNQINVDVGGEFVSTVGGSEDFHLVSDATAIGNGLDLVDTPTDVGIDAVGFDRDAEGVTWDSGAIQYIAAEAAVTYLRQTINPFKNPVIRGM